ncbi:DNA gyrase inhibitor YacG [Psychrobacter ciconiae]|uniref:DNA gyrase inhibitor YacG n=1 Tax=Psychrobacter ciconiae TaxID=1553449 RepID=UPI0038792FA2
MTNNNAKNHNSPTPRQFACPNCGKKTVWQDNAFKPFCSERCKLIDLGAWASEDYRLPADTAPFSDEL